MSPVVDTIAAIATPPGRGGVGIVRVSGPLTKDIAKTLLGELPAPRYARHSIFALPGEDILDIGIALLFSAPHSFTGEDVLELQGHGGPVILDRVLKAVLTLGARLAKPGEFSERAFLNDKIDLTQAEAIADLIDSTSEQAARCAVRSLQGDFSKCIDDLVQRLVELRLYVEAAIDFPEEEIDFLSDGHILTGLDSVLEALRTLEQTAIQGAILREGLHIVIAGKPNAGKSTLLNALSGKESAIVTDIPGTTRDVMREEIHIDGLPLHIIDTAGIREAKDVVEKEGIKRAHDEINKADHVLWLLDSEQVSFDSIEAAIIDTQGQLPDGTQLTVVMNKIDLVELEPKQERIKDATIVWLSAKNNKGIDLLKSHLKAEVGYHQTNEGIFMARRRHLEALARAKEVIIKGKQQLEQNKAGELLAEDLRLAQQFLVEITGEFTADDLLGKIFSSFCIGK